MRSHHRPCPALHTSVFLLAIGTVVPCGAAEAGPLPAPTGLMCELLREPAQTVIHNPRPCYGWVMESDQKDDAQIAYRILVASDEQKIRSDVGDVWDSGRVASRRSINIRHGGTPLRANRAYYWKVRVWNKQDRPSAYAAPQRIRIGEVTEAHRTERQRLVKSEVAPVRVERVARGKTFVDFGRDAFGTVKLTLTSPEAGRQVEVHLGEVCSGGSAIDRSPGGSRRYRKMTLSLEEGTHTYVVEITPDKRNTGKRAIKMPAYIGEVMPFRYAEIVGHPGPLDAEKIRQVVVHYPFDEEASAFASSDEILNAVWELCKYTMKATSFCGVYIDGDRERIPYEADAYINQLGHYGVDREYAMARYTHEYLIRRPTWPTEWILHSVLMAWADYAYTGNTESLKHFYDDLCAKTLVSLSRGDGLISTRTGKVTPAVLDAIHFQGELRDIVDWPHGSLGGVKGKYGETDGYEFGEINTVVNAFHCHALELMTRIAGALNRVQESQMWARRAGGARTSFNAKLLDKDKGIYVDGEGIEHSSLHANMFPLAFGLVPAKYVPTVKAFLKSRGMVCSVYGAQHYLDALYQAGADDFALDLMTETNERGWYHMIKAGSTITMEAWDNKFKPNQDWNHAWGAAPANVIPRRLMGVEPIVPGFGRMRIRPQPGDLAWAKLTTPTIRGPVHVAFTQEPGKRFRLTIRIPANTTADVYLPRLEGSSRTVTVDGAAYEAKPAGRFLCVAPVGSGEHVFEVHAGK